MRRPGQANRRGPRCATGQFSRQRLQQVERSACRKLGVCGSVAQVVHAAERFDRAMRLRERARHFTPSGFHCPSESFHLPKLTPRELELETLTVAFLRAHGAA